MDQNHPVANSYDLDKLKASADVIREISDNEVYLGFCTKGTTGTDQPKWSILQILTDSNAYPKVTTFKWANGQCMFNLVFDQYATFDYSFKTF